MNRNRTTTILGAGAVLDFDFQGKTIPTTWNITNKLLSITVQGLYEDRVNIIREVYDCLYENAQKAYCDFHTEVRHYEPNVNFEELFDVIETLASYNTAWLKEGYPFPMVSSLVSPNVHYQSIEYHRALEAMVKTILDIVNEYNSDFTQNNEKELWFRNFWKGFEGKNDVFNLNYDTTIENSLNGEYNDGFIPFVQHYKRFSPKYLINNEHGVTTVNHLHGCVLYADANPLIGQYEYSHRDLFKFQSHKDAFLSRQWMPTNQANERIFYSPIITGLKKTDKICYLPHSYYHTNLSMKILENPSLLIVGYSFGDIYVNQLLERHKLIHGDEQRVVVIDKYPNYVNKECPSLFQHISNKTSGYFHGFMLRQLEEANQSEALRNNIERIDSNVWQA
ncbi:MAG: SIR2 family protein, partial [Prevotellaceae bacterium]|nr:SIR2 family protein [Prevotellaceae bacterium]